MQKESLNEKMLSAVISIFSCGTSTFERFEDEKKIPETPDFGMKRRSIHFSMMLDHLTKL